MALIFRTQHDTEFKHEVLSATINDESDAESKEACKRLVCVFDEQTPINEATELRIRLPVMLLDPLKPEQVINMLLCNSERWNTAAVDAAYRILQYLSTLPYIEQWLKWVLALQGGDLTMERQFSTWKMTKRVASPLRHWPPALRTNGDFVNYATFARIHHISILADPDDSVIPFDGGPLRACLSAETCVVAGGAVLNAFVPEAAYSDIDYFVLEGPHRRETVTWLIATAKEQGYEVFSSSESVFTCVATYPTTPLQIIMTSAQTAHELVQKFDLSYVRCFFDGQQPPRRTLAAKYCHFTKSCQYEAHCVPTARLHKAKAKGFALSKQHELDLDTTVAVEPQSSPVYFSADIPRDVQLQMFRRMRLIPVDVESLEIPANIESKDSQLQFARTNDDDPYTRVTRGVGVVCSATELAEGITRHPTQFKYGRGQFTQLESRYEWQLPTLRLLFDIDERLSILRRKVFAKFILASKESVAAYSDVYEPITGLIPFTLDHCMEVRCSFVQGSKITIIRSTGLRETYEFGDDSAPTPIRKGAIACIRAKPSFLWHGRLTWQAILAEFRE